MDAITLFKQAAVALKDDPRFIALENARMANDADPELQRMIGEFGQLNSEYESISLTDEADRLKLVDLQNSMNGLYDQIMQNENMIAYRAAQEEIEKLVAYLDRIISAAVNGADPMLVEETPSGGCSGCCSSCGGCG